MNKPWHITHNDDFLGKFSVGYELEPRRGCDSITFLEVKLNKPCKLGVDEASRLIFRRVNDDYRCWVWNLTADNRVILQGGALIVEEREPSLTRLIELAGYSEYF